MVCKSYILNLSLANRGRVIAAINRRPHRLSKLLSILKQNAFPRFIIARSALTFLPLFYRYSATTLDSTRDLSSVLSCCHLLIVNDDNGRTSGNLIVCVSNIWKGRESK